MARELGLYLMAIMSFSSLTIAIASAERLPQDFLSGILATLLLLVLQPALLWIVAHGTDAGWRI